MSAEETTPQRHSRVEQTSIVKAIHDAEQAYVKTHSSNETCPEGITFVDSWIEMMAFVEQVITGELPPNQFCQAPPEHVYGGFKGGSTALMIACQGKSWNKVAGANLSNEHVRAIVAAGAEVNFRRPDNGVSALFSAVKYGDIETLEILLQAGADVKFQDVHGKTAMINAVEQANVAIVQRLLHEGLSAQDTASAVNGSSGDLEYFNAAEFMLMQHDVKGCLSWRTMGPPKVTDYAAVFVTLLRAGARLSARTLEFAGFYLQASKNPDYFDQIPGSAHEKQLRIAVAKVAIGIGRIQIPEKYLVKAPNMNPAENESGGMELECTICLDPVKKPVRLHCSHSFCRDCILEHAQKTNGQGCPLCRTSLPFELAGLVDNPTLALGKSTKLGSFRGGHSGVHEMWGGPSERGPAAMTEEQLQCECAALGLIDPTPTSDLPSASTPAPPTSEMDRAVVTAVQELHRRQGDESSTPATPGDHAAVNGAETISADWAAEIETAHNVERAIYELETAGHMRGPFYSSEARIPLSLQGKKFRRMLLNYDKTPLGSDGPSGIMDARTIKGGAKSIVRCGRLHIESANTATILNGKATLAAPTHGPACIPIEVHGTPLYAFVSTASSLTVISKALADQLGLKCSDLKSSKFFNADTTLTAQLVYDFAITVGGVTVKIPSTIASADVSRGVQLGMDFFAQAVYSVLDVICFEKEMVTVSPFLGSDHWRIRNMDHKTEQLRFYQDGGAMAVVPLVHIRDYGDKSSHYMATVSLDFDRTCHCCNWCSRPFHGMFKCPTCKAAGVVHTYCCTGCQKAAWSLHKLSGPHQKKAKPGQKQSKKKGAAAQLPAQRAAAGTAEDEDEVD
jgi:hypothetical protein